MLAAQRGGQLVGTEQRQVDVDGTLRGITQVDGAHAARRQGQREQEVAVRHGARPEWRPVAGRVHLPAIAGLLVHRQRVDERVALAQVDESLLASRVAQRETHPPGRRRETDIRGFGRGRDESRIRGSAADVFDVERALRVFQQLHRRAQRGHPHGLVVADGHGLQQRIRADRERRAN